MTYAEIAISLAQLRILAAEQIRDLPVQVSDVPGVDAARATTAASLSLHLLQSERLAKALAATEP